MERKRVAEEVGNHVVGLGVAGLVEHDEQVLLRVLVPVGGEVVLVQRDHVVR